MKDLTKDQTLEKVIDKIKKLIKEYYSISYSELSGGGMEIIHIGELRLHFFNNKLTVSCKGYDIGVFHGDEVVHTLINELKSIELNRQKEEAFKYLEE